MDKPQHLADLQESDLAQWRDLPVSRLVLQHLQSEKHGALLTSVDHQRSDDRHKATLAIGGYDALDTLWSLLHPPEKPAEPEEEPFIDPALR